MLHKNYRLISLLCIVGKVIERVIYSRIEGHFKSKNIVIPEQFGFKRGHCTKVQLVRVCDYATNAFNTKKHVELTRKKHLIVYGIMNLSVN